MGGHYHTTLSLAGKVDYPVLIKEAAKRGKELPTAMNLLLDAKEKLQSSFPDLFLLDGLYFNRTTFDVAHSLGTKILIKSKDSKFRNVLRLKFL
jgi:hypothetical protein